MTDAIEETPWKENDKMVQVSLIKTCDLCGSDNPSDDEISCNSCKEALLKALDKKIAHSRYYGLVLGNLNHHSHVCHEENKQWWVDLETGEYSTDRNKGELICLMHSELSEAMEGVRKGLMDDKLPHRKMEEVELADCLIRIFDYAGGFGLDLDGAFSEKMAYNKERADHKIENRKLPGGKKF